MKLLFSEQAFEEYSEWQKTEKKISGKINTLFKDISRSPFSGLGRPEPLKGDLRGYWIRRIDDTNRIVYRVTQEYIEIIQCKGYYDDWTADLTILINLKILIISINLLNFKLIVL